jgi:hypothetical protein
MGWFTRRNPVTRNLPRSQLPSLTLDNLDHIVIYGFRGGHTSVDLPDGSEKGLEDGIEIVIVGKYTKDIKNIKKTEKQYFDNYHGYPTEIEKGIIETVKDQIITIPTFTSWGRTYISQNLRLEPGKYDIEKVTYKDGTTRNILMNMDTGYPSEHGHHKNINGNRIIRKHIVPTEGGRRKRQTKGRKAKKHSRRRRTIRA